MTILRAIAAVLALALVCVGLPTVAQVALPTGGQTQTRETTIPEDLRPADVAEIVSRLSDGEVRRILLERLDAVAQENAVEAAATGSTFNYLWETLVTAPVGAISLAVERLPRLASGQATVFENIWSAFGARGLLQIFGVVLAGVALGLALEWAVTRLLNRRFDLATASAGGEHQPLRKTLKFLFLRLMSEALGLFAFAAGTIIALRTLAEPETLSILRVLVLSLVVAPRAAAAFNRFFLSPQKPRFRLVRATQEWADFYYRHTVGFTFLVGFSIFTLTLNAQFGMPMGELRLGFWLNLSQHLYIAWVAFMSREALSDMMRGYDPEITRFEENMARVYPWLMVVLAIGTWWAVNILVVQQEFEFLQSVPHFKTMLLLGMAPAIDTAMRGLVRHLVPPMQGQGPLAERAYQSTKRAYVRIGRVLIFSIVILQVAGIWGLSLTGLASAGVGERIAARLVEFLLIMSVGYLLYEIVSLWVNRKLAAEMTSAGYDPDNADFGGDGGGTGGSRLSTVLPLVLLVARVTIVVLFLLLGLSNIGVDTTPLLAGAGIVGLAIGFGAQKLVTDVVSGIFFLVDDAFRTGEYVEVDGTMGTVEKTSIRSMQLRHHRGPVHTIPYGEIPKLTNYSRDWVIMKLRFTVPFGTDPNHVKKLFKRIGAEMLEHPDLGGDFLQPFKSQGVMEFDDVGIVIRGKFMAKPGKQFMIRKELFNRINAAFKDAGIEFARREVRVAIPGLEDADDLTSEQKNQIAAAASQAAEEQNQAEPGR
ncbi:MAG: mechanosensitive ion channel domain-containing protein [Pseudomonadota bacterium]